MTKRQFYTLYCEHCSQSNPGELCIEFQVSCFCEFMNQHIEAFEDEPVDKNLKVKALSIEL